MSRLLVLVLIVLSVLILTGIASQKEKGLPLRGFSPPWLDP